MPELALPCLRSPVRIDGAQHATVLGAQALASLIPLVVVVAIFTPGKIALFADSGEVESGLTWVLVFASVMVTGAAACAVVIEAWLRDRV